MKKNMKYKTSLIALAAAMLFIPASSFADDLHSNQIFKLTNNKGEVVYEQKPYEASQKSDNSAQDLHLASKSHSLANELLKKGEAALFYIAEDNPQRKTNIVRTSMSFKEATKLSKQLKGQSVKILDTIQQKYKFDSASVTYHPVLSDSERAKLTDQLEQQAVKSGKGYAMQKLKLTGKHWNLFSTYKNGSSELLVQAMKSDEKITILTPSEQTGVTRELINSGGTEMLYSSYIESESQDFKSSGQGITFVYSIPNSEFHIKYHIEDIGSKLSKQEFIKLAQSYLK
ncbi:hypothetical protein PAECIP112173_03715 [Paenibacillus sp. JJ-100]|uniref:hypothetical protein n=1 Tax=Paenibacillus sp. JJ-100 TaxID=2974896 RepID=UPI0022FFBDDF|nr:hypothetical protein [Paenibacillus sp. JJ-100]CAI6082890.1 hypothetical protein PAECIP112173_03715 [Paenibacillus sp. JJ-100]